MGAKIKMGSHNKLPYYSVVGFPSDFYVYFTISGTYTESEGASGWIKGRADLYHELVKLRKKNKKQFAEKVESLHQQHNRG